MDYRITIEPIMSTMGPEAYEARYKEFGATGPTPVKALLHLAQRMVPEEMKTGVGVSHEANRLRRPVEMMMDLSSMPDIRPTSVFDRHIRDSMRVATERISRRDPPQPPKPKTIAGSDKRAKSIAPSVTGGTALSTIKGE